MLQASLVDLGEDAAVFGRCTTNVVAGGGVRALSSDEPATAGAAMGGIVTALAAAMLPREVPWHPPELI